MTETTGGAPRRRRVLTIGGTVPAEWKALVAITADFEPEDDADLLAWMAAEVNGMSAYAEALTEVYETGVGSIGLDPVSLAALHDTADAAADAAQAMAAARAKFATHYQEVREFAAAGGCCLMTAGGSPAKASRHPLSAPRNPDSGRFPGLTPLRRG
jgi:hypothetical protein